MQQVLRHHKAAYTFLSALALCVGCAAQGGNKENSAADSTQAHDAAGAAQLALANAGEGPCVTNSLGGTGFVTSGGSSCNDSTEWCADFVMWVWQNSGFNIAGLSPGAVSFYQYGQTNNTMDSAPHVGDAIVYDVNSSGTYASHVEIVVAINSDGSLQGVSGNGGGGVVSPDSPCNTVGCTYGGQQVSAFVSPIGGAGTGSSPPPSSGSSSGGNGSSSGSGSGGNGSSGSSSGGSPSCAPDGNGCGQNSDCCNQDCNGGTCGGPTCAPDGNGCGQNSDCCNQDCNGGTCGGPTCASDGYGCGQDSDCCNQDCNGGTCGGATCAPDGYSCGQDSDCCNQDCNGGTCGGPTCAPDGDGCGQDSDCCNQDCNGGVCGAPSCGNPGDACGQDSDCCSNSCDYSGTCD